MAATSTILELLDAGDHVIASDDLYGGTYRLMEDVRRTSSLDFSFVDFSSTENILKEIKSNTKMLWLETPSNCCQKLLILRKFHQLLLIKILSKSVIIPFHHPGYKDH